MQNDRNYYRLCDNAQLIFEAKESDNELAIVLGERLSDALWDVVAADRAEMEYLQREIEELRAELAEANDTIEDLMTENNK